MAIYRTLYYAEAVIGTEGRMTIPKTMREDCGIADGDTMVVRVEETPQGSRQLVMWRKDRGEDF